MSSYKVKAFLDNIRKLLLSTLKDWFFQMLALRLGALLSGEYARHEAFLPQLQEFSWATLMVAFSHNSIFSMHPQRINWHTFDSDSFQSVEISAVSPGDPGMNGRGDGVAQEGPVRVPTLQGLVQVEVAVAGGRVHRPADLRSQSDV